MIGWFIFGALASFAVFVGCWISYNCGWTKGYEEGNKAATIYKEKEKAVADRYEADQKIAALQSAISTATTIEEVHKLIVY